MYTESLESTVDKSHLKTGSNIVIIDITKGLENHKQELIKLQCLMLDTKEEQKIQVLDELEKVLKKHL